jgi:hypothetical protein
VKRVVSPLGYNYYPNTKKKGTTMKTFLITGGSGLVARRLSELLLQQGYSVKHLSRNPKSTKDIRAFKWDILQQYVDPLALQDVDVVIHLAGAEIMEKRWSQARKQIILDSRVNSLKLLYDFLSKNKNQVETLISSSAQGYYQPNQGQILNEDAPAGAEFMGELCRTWETEALKWEQLGIRVAINRIGLVFSADGGVLEVMRPPIEKGFSAYFGKGKQIYPWIHIDDLCGMIIYEAENEALKGAFNAASPNAVDQKEVNRSIASYLQKSVISFPVPKFILSLMMGAERASVLADSFHLSAAKIQKTGFTFKYPTLDEALTNLL